MDTTWTVDKYGHWRHSFKHSSRLTKIAERAWPNAAKVVFARDNLNVATMAPGGRRYQLERLPIMEHAPVYLGDCEQAAETKLRALVAAVDLDQVADEVAAQIKAMKPGQKREKLPGALFTFSAMRCTRKGRIVFAVRDDQIRGRILSALGPGWTYTKRGGFWDRP